MKRNLNNPYAKILLKLGIDKLYSVFEHSDFVKDNYVDCGHSEYFEIAKKGSKLYIKMDVADVGDSFACLAVLSDIIKRSIIHAASCIEKKKGLKLTPAQYGILIEKAWQVHLAAMGGAEMIDDILSVVDDAQWERSFTNPQVM